MKIQQPNTNNPRRTLRKIWGRGAVIVVLCAMLLATTYALQLPGVKVQNNFFQMGLVDVDLKLNQGESIFGLSNGSIEPGQTLVEEVTVQNRGEVALYYRLYLEHLQGELLDMLEFSIYHGDELLFQGTAGELTLENPCRDTVALAPGEERTLSIQVYLPKTVGNMAQAQELEFDVKVDGVQAPNNPQQQFE